MSAHALRYSEEARHFDTLVDRTGESWWGHATAAGRRRLSRRARLIADAMPLGSSVQVMEIAAGAGALTEAVLNIAPAARITATDISPVSVGRLRKRLAEFPNVESKCADITSLDFPDNSFDAVIGNSALHHVDVEACLRELHRVLRPGGRLVVFEPNLLNPEVWFETALARRFASKHLDYSDSERTHTRWTYARKLRQAGFTSVRVRPFDFLHPVTPSWLVPSTSFALRTIEFLPVVREFSGSLLLAATKPTVS